uniref:Large ribosomal subunit protein uL14m n=1 Tax=Anser cygnoides TaxID=8845 RepID=A0A8B9E2R1_ANSCY
AAQSSSVTSGCKGRPNTTTDAGSWQTEHGLNSAFFLCWKGGFQALDGDAEACKQKIKVLVFLSQVQKSNSQPLLIITRACQAIQKLTRVRVVDNSALGNTPYHRPPKCIHVYNKTGVGKVGDTILLAIKGEKKKALIVGHKMPGPCMTPRFDSNNVVLIEDNGNPIGTRIKTPIPYTLRQKGEFSKVLAIARNFV